MDVSPEVQQLAVALAGTAIRNSAQSVFDRVGALRAAGKAQDTIAGLEQIINDLISDKNDLTRIAQAYQAELVAQRLTPGDVQYVTNTVVPLIQQLAEGSSDGNTEQAAEMMKTLSPLLSAETVNVLQILGFNFRRAVGDPLTTLVERLILANAPGGKKDDDLETLKLRREIAYAEVALDPEALARLKAICS